MVRSRHYRLLSCALLSCLLAGCRPASEAQSPSLSLDQGFEALFPALTASLARTYGRSLEPGPAVAAASVVVASPYSAARILEAEAAREGSGPGPRNGAAAPGSAPPERLGTTLIVPFAGPSLAALPSVRSIGYDYDEAYARMGAEAAKALSRRRDGEKSACAIVFQPNFLRGESALEAFSAAFAAATAGEGRLVVKNLPSNPEAVDPAGAAAAAIREAEGPEVGLVVLAVDELTPAAAAAAKGGGSRIYFADMSTWEAAKQKKSLFGYRVEGDEAALARAATGLADKLARGGAAAPRTLVRLKAYRSFFNLFQKIF